MSAVLLERKDSSSWEASSFYTKAELDSLDLKKMPAHVAFIPDGNRRWARKQRVFPEEGHKVGADALLNVIKASRQLGIEILTFYIFSTENWLRPRREIKAQLWLLEKYLIEQKKEMIENGVRFRTIGDLSKFPQRIRCLVDETVAATKQCGNITVVFAMNYGGRDDITRAVKKIICDCRQGKLDCEEVSETLISTYLDTAEWKDPDLLIRTSGESRISNFLLWQISYTEICLSNVCWPEFTPQEFLAALVDYQKRERRRGV